MNTLMEFQVIEVGSAYRGRYKVFEGHETPLIPKVGDVISLEPVHLRGNARVVSVEDKIVLLDNVPSGNNERREILLHVEKE
jgi:hypothetical protein